jgi:hypothetical protein
VHHALDVVIRNGKALDGTIDTLITLLTMKLANTSVYELEVGQPLPGVCSLPTDDLKSFRYFVTPTRAHSGGNMADASPHSILARPLFELGKETRFTPRIIVASPADTAAGTCQMSSDEEEWDDAEPLAVRRKQVRSSRTRSHSRVSGPDLAAVWCAHVLSSHSRNWVSRKRRRADYPVLRRYSER